MSETVSVVSPDPTGEQKMCVCVSYGEDAGVSVGQGNFAGVVSYSDNDAVPYTITPQIMYPFETVSEQNKAFWEMYLGTVGNGFCEPCQNAPDDDVYFHIVSDTVPDECMRQFVPYGPLISLAEQIPTVCDIRSRMALFCRNTKFVHKGRIYLDPTHIADGILNKLFPMRYYALTDVQAQNEVLKVLDSVIYSIPINIRRKKEDSGFVLPYEVFGNMSVPGLSRPDTLLAESYRRFKAFGETGVDVLELSRSSDSWWSMFAQDVTKDYASSVGIDISNFQDAALLVAYIRLDVRQEVEYLVDNLSNPCVADTALLTD